VLAVRARGLTRPAEFANRNPPMRLPAP